MSGFDTSTSREAFMHCGHHEDCLKPSTELAHNHTPSLIPALEINQGRSRPARTAIDESQKLKRKRPRSQLEPEEINVKQSQSKRTLPHRVASEGFDALGQKFGPETPELSNDGANIGIGRIDGFEMNKRGKSSAQPLNNLNALCSSGKDFQVVCSLDTIALMYLRQEVVYRIMNLEMLMMSQGKYKLTEWNLKLSDFSKVLGIEVSATRYSGWDLRMAGVGVLTGAMVLISRADCWKLRRIQSCAWTIHNVVLLPFEQ